MNLDQLASVLTATYSATSTHSAQLATSQLAELSASTVPFLVGLLDLGLATDRDLRNSALTNFNHFLLQTIANNALPQSTRLQFIEKINGLLASPVLEAAQKDIIAGVIAALISTDSQDSYVGYFQVCVELVLRNLAGSAAEIQGGLYISKTLLNNFHSHLAIHQILQRLVPALIQVAEKAVVELTSALSSQDSKLAGEIVNVLRNWTCVFASVFSAWDNTSTGLVKLLIQFTGLAGVFRDCLGLILPSPLSEAQLLLSFESSDLAGKLNEAKGFIIEILNVVLQHYVETKKQTLEAEGKVLTAMVLVGVSLPDSPFVHLVELTVQPLVASLVTLCHDDRFQDLLALKHVKAFAFQALSLLHRASSENRFYPLFSPLYRDLVMHVLLPLLVTNADDLVNFEENPAEFVAEGEEICEVQEKETVKNASAHLLESMCEFVDGCLAFSARVFIELLSLGWNEREQAILQAYSSARILTFSRALSVDVALLGLCILSYDISTRKDIKDELELTIEHVFASLESLQSDLVRGRFCLLLRYYSEHLFLFESAHKFNYFVQYLLNCLESRCPAVSLQACSTLNHIMLEDDLMFRIEELAPEIIGCYVSLIPKMHNKEFFESLEELVLKYPEHICKSPGALVGNLTARVLQEAPETKKNTILLTKSLNVIKSVTHSSELPLTEVSNLESQIEGLLMLLRNPQSISFEDELLQLQKALIFKSQAVSPIGWRVFEFIPAVFEKNKGQFLQLFPLLNVYFSYGRDTIFASPQYLQKVLEMCRTNLFLKPKGVESESTNTEAALLYQLMLQLSRNELDPYLDPILSAVISRYASAKNDFFKARLLGVVMNAFSYNAILTMQLLSNSQMSPGVSYLKYILTEIFANSHCFLHSYDKRVSVLGLCSLMTQETLASEVCQSLNAIFQVIILILSQSKGDSRPDLDLLAKLASQFSGDDDSDDDSMARLTQFTKSQMMANFNSEEGQANLTLALLLTPLQQVDEYQHFKGLLNTIRSRSSEALSKLISPLSADLLSKLEQIIQSERVRVNELAGENTTVRRKVRPKKRQ